MQKLLYHQQNEQNASDLRIYMSLTYKRKSTGPNTEPCGTLNVMFDIEELQFLIETYCFLLLKYDSNQHDTSDAIMQELTHQYVMINSVECFEGI